MVPLVFTLTYLLAAVTLASPINPPGLAQDSATTTSLLTRRSSTFAYTALKTAAKKAGVSIRDGEWHYLRLCKPLEAGVEPKDDVQRETGCRHFYLAVGQVVIKKQGTFSSSKKDFEALMYQVRYINEESLWYWTSHEYDWYEDQDVLYGGRTTSTKAEMSRLDALSTAWVETWGSQCDMDKARCFGYYQHMGSHL